MKIVMGPIMKVNANNDIYSNPVEYDPKYFKIQEQSDWVASIAPYDIFSLSIPKFNSRSFLPEF